MEGRITEEQVTKIILKWLETTGWEIICFDFPQSGTGISLHLNEDLRDGKNKGVIIPDIIAIKNNEVVFFENKNRFELSDFLKLENLKTTNNYTMSISKLLKKIKPNNIFLILIYKESHNSKHRFCIIKYNEKQTVYQR